MVEGTRGERLTPTTAGEVVSRCDEWEGGRGGERAKKPTSIALKILAVFLTTGSKQLNSASRSKMKQRLKMKAFLAYFFSFSIRTGNPRILLDRVDLVMR